MAFGYNRISGSNTIQIVGDLVAGADPQRNTKIDFDNDKIDFVAGGVTVLSITPTLISSSTDIYSYGYLRSLNSSGDEGGEILLAKSVTNNTLTGSGITIDSYQNRIRFFEQGGSARGAYIDLTECDPGVGTNLLAGGTGGGGTGDITSVSAGSGLTGGGTSGAVTLSLSSSISVTSISASTYIGLPSALTVSGTSAEGTQFNNTVSKITFDNNTGFQVSQSAPNEVFLSIGSHYKDIVVAGQTTLSATGSDSLEFKGTGGLQITTSLVDSNANSILKEVTFSTTTLSSSISSSFASLEARQFKASSDGLPYYNISSAPSVLTPPSENRSSYVLGWVNNQLAWVLISAGVSFLTPQYAEVILNQKSAFSLENGVSITGGTVV
jgi:hypothetical protein